MYGNVSNTACVHVCETCGLFCGSASPHTERLLEKTVRTTPFSHQAVVYYGDRGERVTEGQGWDELGFSVQLWLDRGNFNGSHFKSQHLRPQ